MMDHRTSQSASAVIGQHKAERASPFVVIGDAQQIRELLCGPIQHNEHMKGWRWHMYVQDDAKRFEAVKAELRKMNAERREREAFADHARDERKHEKA